MRSPISHGTIMAMTVAAPPTARERMIELRVVNLVATVVAMSNETARGSWCAPGDEHLTAAVSGAAWFKYDEDEGNPEAALPVLMRLGADGRGRHVCTGLIVGDVDSYYLGDRPREVNAAVLRSVHLPELIAFALQTREIPDEYGAAVRQLLEAAPPVLAHPGRAGYDDEHYIKVAEQYRRALVEAPGRPSAWLAKELHQSPPTVRRWLAEARRRGHLGPSTPGRAGETKEETE